MWSVDCFGGGVVVGVDEEAGCEPVGAQFMYPEMAGASQAIDATQNILNHTPENPNA